MIKKLLLFKIIVCQAFSMQLNEFSPHLFIVLTSLFQFVVFSLTFGFLSMINLPFDFSLLDELYPSMSILPLPDLSNPKGQDKSLWFCGLIYFIFFSSFSLIFFVVGQNSHDSERFLSSFFIWYFVYS